ncbi:LysR family transcriptional regulator [Ideonella sp. BN130291]|uniref:LysR family transcriptional regulator n=1 Tax=Ideonella sp. BN130291 TaxID=3112940 RepID=UPI002E252477|nr:LysR family transcriptional regulator [Ideonella sp. BN130291]
MAIEPNDLLLFARVVESGSFSRAAERVHLPKSTVSRRIAELERQLGERLLQRTTRKLSVTDFGLSVLDHARQVAEEVDGATALALHRQARPSGKLRVSMPGDFASVTLSGMLAQFVREHPAISLELDLTPRRVDLIGENFDLAIRMGELPQDSQLTARRLAVFSTSLYASPEYLSVHGEPQTPEALLGLHGLMVLSRSGDALPWELQSEDGEVEWSAVPDQRTAANSPDLLIRLARSGAGVAAVANYFAEPYVRAGELRRLLAGWHHKPSVAWAVFAGRRLMPAKTRVFLDALSSVLSTAPDVEARCVEEERRQRERQASASA